MHTSRYLWLGPRWPAEQRRPPSRGPRLIAAAALVSAALIFACDGDRKIEFPQPDDTPISALTAADLQEICLLMSRPVMNDLRVAICTSQGLAAAMKGEGSCEQVMSDCLAQPEEKYDPDKICSSVEQADVDRLDSCSITVGEYEACANAIISQMDSMLGQISCSSTIEELQELQKMTSYQLPEVCQRLDERCPGIDFGGVGTDDGSGSGTGSGTGSGSG